MVKEISQDGYCSQVEFCLCTVTTVQVFGIVENTPVENNNIIDARKMRWNFNLKQYNILCGMLFQQTDFFGFKTNMMLEISILTIGDGRNDLKDLFFLCSQRKFCLNNLY